ncbi:MAG: LPS export ABC transporter periplasmic protein LptC [Thermodesulfobacteriota bacterium]
MKRRTRILLFGFVIVSVAGLAVAVLMNAKVNKAMELASMAAQVASLEAGGGMDEIRYYGTKDGVTEWEMEADSATRLADEDLTVFENVRFIFYSKDGGTYTLTGKEGRYSEKNERIEITGAVKVVSDDGYSLLTERLDYSTRSREATSEVEVELLSRGMKITGVGFRMNVEGGGFSVLRDVKTVLSDVSI